jgi:hypothetical protein
MLTNIKNPVTRQSVEGSFTLVRSAVRLW